MPVDPEVAVGTLPNGLRYYVRPNARPARRAELRLVVKAGSVLEDDDQQGLAHFVEHMLFEGTQNFPRQGINDVPGVARVWASAPTPTRRRATTTRSTRCACRPTCPARSTARCSCCEDWAQRRDVRPGAPSSASAASCSPSGGMHLGAGERTRDKIRRVQLEGSRYANRSPIGEPEVIERAQREQLMRFYRDWYRPDLMAVIVVGDVDRDAVVGDDQDALLVADQSGADAAAAGVRRAGAARHALHHRHRQGNDRDRRWPSATCGRRATRTRSAAIAQIMMDQLFGDMLDARLDELSQRENPPFLARRRAAAACSRRRGRRTRRCSRRSSPNDGVARGLDALVTEIQRVARFGFTATELARAKQARMPATSAA